MIPNRAPCSIWTRYSSWSDLLKAERKMNEGNHVSHIVKTYNRLPVPYNAMLMTVPPTNPSHTTQPTLHDRTHRLITSFSFPLDPACPCVIGCCFPPTSSMPTTYPPSGLASTCPASTTCIPPLVAPFTSSPSACKTTVSPFCNLALTKPLAVPLSRAFRPIPRTSI